MQDEVKLENALARARGDLSYLQMNKSQFSDASSPLSGGDVKICPNCIKRERKRANRKKQRKPEEEEIFQRDEEKRIVVFNTTELRDWVEPPRTPGSEHLPPGTMQVELPMRIACYCRHQSEKLGFQVIFTIKDYQDNVVAQSITNSIMITDDHKTHTTAAAQPVSSLIPDPFNLPGAGVFSAGNQMDAAAAGTNPYPNPFRLSHSTTDLSSLRQPSLYSHQPQLAANRSMTRIPSGVALPTAMSRQSPGSVTNSLSTAGTRHTSPVDRQGPSSKRRKHSGPGRIPPELAMTRLNGSHSNSPSAVQDGQFKSSDRVFGMQPTTPSLPPSLSPGPQLAGDSLLINQLTETLPHEMVSTPGSAHTSRPGSPTSARPSDPRFSAAALSGNQIFGMTPPNSLARVPPAMIHKLVPSEGSTTGGNEVTILGSGFFPGMEVVFGDTLATTTTFWGDKCLNCLTPPALHPGRVQVTFKHEHPLLGGVQQPPQSIMPKQMIFYTYVDDRELQMYRLALGILGQKLGNPADAYQTAQQIMGSDTSGLWNMPNGYANGGQNGGGGGGQQQGGGYQGHTRSTGTSPDRRTNELDIKMSEYLKFFDLDVSSDGLSNGRDSENDDLLNTKSSSGGQTLLHLAASLGLTHFLNGLLLRGADPNAKDNNENTPLHLAALGGDVAIVNRLRLGGADIHSLNKSDMTPADLATTLEAHQALLTGRSRRRTRSVGSSSSTYTHLRRRSLDSFWEPSASEESSDAASSDGSKDDGDDEDESEEVSDSESDNRSSSPARSADGRASLYAWREQLAAQINVFHQNVNRKFPNLGNLPPLPNLTDYHNHSMVKRITSLVPTKPSTIVKDSWDRLTGHTPSQSQNSPPAYEDLYPEDGKPEKADYDLKNSSLAEAAVDAAADAHFEAAESSAAARRGGKDGKAVKTASGVQMARKNIPRGQHDQLRMTHDHKLKRIGSDLNLFLVWVCCSLCFSLTLPFPRPLLTISY